MTVPTAALVTPELTAACAGVARPIAWLPAALPFRPNALDDPFDGNFERLNW